MTGFTYSSDFPTPPGAYDSTHAGSADVFVTKLDAAGGTLAYSSSWEARTMTLAGGIAVDAVGDGFVAGYTFSAIFRRPPAPTTRSQRLSGCLRNEAGWRRRNAGSAVLGGPSDDIDRVSTSMRQVTPI